MRKVIFLHCNLLLQRPKKAVDFDHATEQPVPPGLKFAHNAACGFLVLVMVQEFGAQLMMSIVQGRQTARIKRHSGTPCCITRDAQADFPVVSCAILKCSNFIQNVAPGPSRM